MYVDCAKHPSNCDLCRQMHGFRSEIMGLLDVTLKNGSDVSHSVYFFYYEYIVEHHISFEFFHQ